VALSVYVLGSLFHTNRIGKRIYNIQGSIKWSEYFRISNFKIIWEVKIMAQHTMLGFFTKYKIVFLLLTKYQWMLGIIKPMQQKVIIRKLDNTKGNGRASEDVHKL
jgi:hypothetical protein